MLSNSINFQQFYVKVYILLYFQSVEEYFHRKVTGLFVENEILFRLVTINQH